MKWENQKFYEVSLDLVTVKIITLKVDTNFKFPQYFYWGGNITVTSLQRNSITANIQTQYTDVLPILWRKDNIVRALLPLSSVNNFQSETGLKFEDGLSVQLLGQTIKSKYGVQV